MTNRLAIQRASHQGATPSSPRMNKRTILTGSLAVLAVTCTHAADFLGANEILSRKAAIHKTPKKPDTAETPADIWKREMAAFKEATLKLAPEEAASRWLKLVESGLKVSATDSRSFRSSFDNLGPWRELMGALPPPSSWEALDARLKALPLNGNNETYHAALRALGSTLHGDYAALPPLVERITEHLAKPEARLEASFDPAIGERLIDWINAIEENPKAIVEQFKRSLNRAPDPNAFYSLEIPDLVTLVSEKEAEPLLLRALQLRTTVEIPVGDATRELAKKIAIANAKDLPTPPWKLITSVGPSSIALYEALVERFKTPDSPDGGVTYERMAAARYYLLSLIAAGR